MKKITLIFLATFISIGIYAQKKSNYKVFPFKSGIIEYQKTGKTKGTTTKYIDEYGYKQADYGESITKIFGHKTEEKEETILIGPTVYTINYKENTVNKGKNPVYETYANSKGNYDELGKKSMKALGFSDTGETETILGKKCEIWKGSLGEICIWKGLALKTKTKIFGMKMEEVATKINIDTKVSASKFEIPKGMEIQEIEIPEGLQEGLNSLFGGQN
ncbi:MAG: hypothetical protein J7K34_10935 [Flavobacteriaceae bacterium]|nr:hypothetical protein [Flavobacteriaceae bacterium]